MHERCDDQEDDINGDTSAQHSTSSASRRNDRQALGGWDGDDGPVRHRGSQSERARPTNRRPGRDLHREG